MLKFDIELRREPRKLPIKHRNFDISQLYTAFPEQKLTPLETGLRATANHLMRAT